MKQQENYPNLIVPSTTKKAVVLACLLLFLLPGEIGPSCPPKASPRTQRRLSMASVFVRRSPAPPRVWGMLMDYWQVPASLAVTWWRALGRSHHARALAVLHAVLLFGAGALAEAYELAYCVGGPQAESEALEGLVDEGELIRRQATTIEEAVLRKVDREGAWR